ncbi:MAG: PAS domain-containing protein [Holosporales bacterium]|jgi:PAS domain-containing protein|nr:PAS domain-containing protein [Holosporales bacterium]
MSTIVALVVTGVALLSAVTLVSVFIVSSRDRKLEDPAVALLQGAAIPWCIIPLEGSNLASKTDFVCSNEFLRIMETDCPSWETLMQRLNERATYPPPSETAPPASGNSNNKSSSFQRKVQDLIKYGQADPMNAYINERIYRVSMHINQVRIVDKETGQESFHKGILLTLHDVTEVHKLKDLYDDALKKVNDLLRVLNTVPFPVWTRRQDGCITFCNMAYAKLLETHPYQVLSRQWELIDGVNAKDAKNLHKCVIEEKKGKSIEVKKKLKGEEKTYKIYEDVTDTIDSSEEYAVVGTAVDMSNTLASSKLLQKQIQLCNDALNFMETPFALVNGAGEVVMYNNAMEQLLGIKLDPSKIFMDEVLEKLRDSDSLPGDIDFVTLKDICRKWVERTNLPFRDMWHMPFGAVLNVHVTAFQDDYVIITLKDITPTLNEESRYKSLQAVWDAMIDYSKDAVLVIGIDHRIQRCSLSTSSLLGREASSLVGLSVKEFLKTFATQHVLHIWQSNLEDAIELRNPHTVTISASGDTLLCEYMPLPGGWHMLRFSKCVVEEKFNSLFGDSGARKDEPCLKVSQL